MNGFLKLGMLTGIVALLGLGTSRAQDMEMAPATNRTLLLVVGSGKAPADPSITARPFAETDATNLHKLLTDGAHAKIAPGDSKLLVGAEATRENTLKGLNWLAEQAKPGDTVLLAMFCQGGPLGDSGDRRCYFLSDSTFAGRDKNALGESEITDALKNLKSDRFAVFLDVNFKGYTTTAKGIAEPSLGQTPYREFLGDDGTDDHGASPGHVVFLATNGLAASLNLPDQGLFGKMLVDGLSGQADTEGGEADGQVTVDEMVEFLEKKMTEKAREIGKTTKEKELIPFVLGGRGNHYRLSVNPEAAKKVQATLAAFKAKAGENAALKAVETEGVNLLESMPRLKAMRNLRKEYEKLAEGGTASAFEKARKEILDGMKLPREAAENYARTVVKATTLLVKEYVKELKQPELVANAIKGLYSRLEEKLPPELLKRVEGAKDLSSQDLTALLADTRQNLGKREDLDKNKDIDISLQRMMAKLDPYTTYIDAETKAAFDKDVQGNFTGIGVQIRRDSVTDMLLVVTPIKGSPAFKAGLQAGDIITRIVRTVDSNGAPLKEPEVISTKGMATTEAVKKILGKPGTPVTVTIQREGQSAAKDYNLVRARIEVESVLGFKRKPNADWDYMIDPKSKIAYIRLTNFARNSARDMSRALDEVRKQASADRQPLRGLVFDLRFNPGGLLDSAVLISDMFVDDGLIVSIRPRGRQETKFNGAAEGSLTDFPMVCMVNSGSASGSEIVSAALQDHNRAYIVGERSFGKGSVQNIKEFGEGEIKLTTATFWRPSGKNLNKSSTAGKEEDTWGVKPNLEVKLNRKERDDLFDHFRDTEIIEPEGGRPNKEAKPAFVDKQLEEALKYLRGQIGRASR